MPNYCYVELWPHILNACSISFYQSCRRYIRSLEIDRFLWCILCTSFMRSGYLDSHSPIIFDWNNSYASCRRVVSPSSVINEHRQNPQHLTEHVVQLISYLDESLTSARTSRLAYLIRQLFFRITQSSRPKPAILNKFWYSAGRNNLYSSCGAE